MKKCFLVLCAGLLYTGSLFAQNPAAVKYSGTITTDDLKKHLTVLASDEYEGRETGKKGQKMAAEYIAKHFESLGFPKTIDNGYFQKYPLVEKTWSERKFIVNQAKYEFMADFYAFHDIDNFKINTNEIIFAGYGIRDEAYDDYAGQSVAGKVILIMAGEPVNKKGISAITKTTETSDWSKGYRKKVEEARELNPALILYLDYNFDANSKKLKHHIESSTIRLPDEKKNETAKAPVIFISREVAVNLLKPNNKVLEDLKAKIDNAGKPKPILLNSTINININHLVSNLSGENVLGYLEGTDKSQELLVITAHYDHIGVIGGEVYNGADDDGSGTVAVMELAEAFAQAKKEGFSPKRSILFMAVSGEEKGLLGSKYYTDHPVYPLANTVANLNIDMIGRVDDKHKTDPNYVYVIGSDKLSTQLHAINEEANRTYTKVALDYTYNDPKDPNQFYYRSDHYNFAKNNIPIIFYFNGTHEDYHQKTDELDKINWDVLSQRTKLIFFTAWELANRDERITVDVKNDFPNDRR